MPARPNPLPVRREGRVHPHPDNNKPTRQVDPGELRKLLEKPHSQRITVGVTPLIDELPTDQLPIVFDVRDRTPTPPPLAFAPSTKAPSIPSLVAFPVAALSPRSIPTEKLSPIPRSSRTKIASEKIVALSKHHGVTIGFVMGAMVAALIFALLG